MPVIPEMPKRPVRRKTAASDAGNSAEITPDSGTPGSKGGIGLGIRDPLVAPFLICLVIGVFLESFGHVPGFEKIALFGPIIATACYPLWGWLSGIYKRASLRERLADNSYYLGFIFTQVSLLVGFGVPALTKSVITSNDVLRFFGIAIGASMIGLIARTLFVQTGHTVSETADIVHDEVEKLSLEVGELAKGVSSAAREILRDLGQISEQFAKSRQDVTREVAEWSGSIAESLKKFDTLLAEQVRVSGRSIEQTDAATVSLVDSLGNGSSILAQNVRSAATAIDSLRQDLSRKLEEASQLVLSSTKSLVEATDAVRTSQGGATTAVAEITVNIRRTSELLGKGAEAMKLLDDLGSKIGGLEVKVDHAVTAGEGMVAEASRRTQDLKKDLESASAVLVTVLKDFREELEAVRA